MNHEQEQLALYAQELSCVSGLTIEQLIDSHRRLREQNAKHHDEIRAEMAQARDAAYAQAHADAMLYSRERLRAMTVAEFAALIGDTD